MQITVYADLLFLTNFLTNLFLLKTTQAILNSGAKFYRRCIAALAGALYAVCVYTKTLSFLGHPLLFALFITAIVLCAFPIYSIRQLLRTGLIFLCVHALYGGLAYALIFTSGFGQYFGAAFKNGVVYLNVPFYIPLAAFGCGHALLCAFKSLVSQISAKSNHLHTLSFTIDKTTYTLPALLDTGNALFDPLTHLPVVIMEANAIKTPVQNLRRIPYRTLAGEVHSLPALYIPNISINGSDAGRCILALTDARLSPDGRFCALLHSALFQGGYDEHSKNISMQTPHSACR